LKLEALLVDADGKKSTLKAKGATGGEMNKGTIEMVQENGQWKVVKQSGTNK
jgi:hypothetical protein